MSGNNSEAQVRFRAVLGELQAACRTRSTAVLAHQLARERMDRQTLEAKLRDAQRTATHFRRRMRALMAQVCQQIPFILSIWFFLFFGANDGCSRPTPVLPDNPASSSVPLPSNIRSWPKTFEAKLPGQC